MKDSVWNFLFILLLSASNLIAFYYDPTTTKLAGVLVPIIFFIGINFVLNLPKKLLVIIFSPLFALSFVDLVYLMQFNVQITAGMISAIMESDAQESYEFVIRAPSSIVFAFILYGSLFLFLFFTSRYIDKGKKKQLVIGLVLILLPIVDMVGKGASARSFPLGAIREAYIYTRDTIVANKLLDQRKAFSFKASSPDVGQLKLVLVLGETSRRDYYSLYGFSRKTNPRLESIQPLAVYTDVISPSNATIPSLMSMLYMATVEDPQQFYTTKSIISLAKEAGYGTYWLSSQARFGEFDATSGATGVEADKKVFINSTRAVSLVYDEELLPYLEESLKGGIDKKFIVMHLYGSHLAYDRRYPKQFDVFKDTPINYSTYPKEIQDKVNHYTNSILYTDYILGEVIQKLMLEKKPACMVYTPDHGEYLADNKGENYTGHGYPLPHRAEVEVPLVVWCNQIYRETNPRKWMTILDNQSLKISNEDLFYSLADLLEIQFSMMNYQRSYLGDKYKPVKARKVKRPSLYYRDLN